MADTTNLDQTTVLYEEVEDLMERANRFTERFALVPVRDRPRSFLSEPDIESVVGIFDDDLPEYARYRIRIKFIDRVMGGTPQKPDIIAGWLKKNIGVTDEEELVRAVRQTLLELGVETPELATLEELTKATEAVAADRYGNTFKKDSMGLFLEGRHVKSMLKEATNIVYAGKAKGDGGRWGATAKGPKSAFAEWVFVDELRLHLGRMEPDGVYTMHGVVDGPQGRRTTLTQYAYCVQPEITFTCFSLEDRVTKDQWISILKHAQFVGLGAIRSQSMGRFKVQEFDRL